MQNNCKYIIVSLWLVLLCSSARVVHGQKQAINVLFIGNSYTYYNNLPSILEQLSENSQEQRKIHTTVIVAGGASLRDHWGKQSTQKILQHNWDYVVIQDQTNFGTLYFVNGVSKIETAEPFYYYASKIDSVVKSHGGHTIVLMRPRMSNMDLDDNKFYIAVYNDFAKRSKLLLVPSALVIYEMQKKGYQLFRDDSLHPTPLSSYCMAVGIYNCIYKKRVSSERTQFRGHIAEEDGQYYPDSTHLLADLSKTEVTLANQLCWTSFIQLQRGYPDLPLNTPSISLPRVPSGGDKGTENQLTGKWAGRIKVYPQYLKWPADLSLHFISKPALKAIFTISFGSDTSQNIQDTCTVTTKDEIISFRSQQGPDGSDLFFRAILRDQKLIGTAEFIKKDDKYFYGIGDWDASPKQDGEEIIKKMYARYSGKWPQSITFEQTTKNYRNDTLRRTQIWNETMLFPDKLRIDVTPLEDHNFYIFRSDSTFIIRNGKLTGARNKENDLIFLLGGMYFLPVDTTIARLHSMGYDLSKSYENLWQGNPVLVIGVSDSGQNSNQLWIDKNDLYVVRVLKYNNGQKEDIHLDDHIKIGGGWTETRTTAFINDKLAQSEEYHNCRIPEKVDPRLFDPYNL
jgi:hypothetical protein